MNFFKLTITSIDASEWQKTNLGAEEKPGMRKRAILPFSGRCLEGWDWDIAEDYVALYSQVY